MIMIIVCNSNKLNSSSSHNDDANTDSNDDSNDRPVSSREIRPSRGGVCSSRSPPNYRFLVSDTYIRILSK